MPAVTNEAVQVNLGGAEAVNSAIALSLGVLADHTIRIFIVVEGVYDIAFLKSLSRMFRSHGVVVPDLDALEIAGEVVFVPAGGADNLAYWASKLSPLNRPEFHLFDRDAPAVLPPKHQAKIDAVNLRSECKGIATSRLELENFVHHEAINACANAQGLACNLGVSYGTDDDVPKLLSAELNQHAPANALWGQTKVKSWLADAVVPTMTPAMVAQIDSAGELLGWMNDIASMLMPPESPIAG